MQKLFIGNLPGNISEQQLKDLFIANGIEFISLKVKPGSIYGFADCPDQNNADRAIDKLNGFAMGDQQLRVEPSMPRRPLNRTSRVQVRQIPTEIEWSELNDMVKEYGEVVNIEHAGSPESPVALITYRDAEDAAHAQSQINGRELHGSALKATLYYDRNNKMQQVMRRTNRGSGDFTGRSNSQADLPLRMAVDARFVGAIIGQGGGTIRTITKDSKARCVVDVNRQVRDTQGSTEKVINIYGLPENTSKACIKILEVVVKEKAKDPASGGGVAQEPELKLRAHNNLVGRLIGKGGTTIKKIMEETGCTVFVSNVASGIGPYPFLGFPALPAGPMGRAGSGGRFGRAAAQDMYEPDFFSGPSKYGGPPKHGSPDFNITELSNFSMERTITLRGPTLEAVSRAEEKVSLKLRQCWENDLINVPQNIFGGPAQVNPNMVPHNGPLPPSFAVPPQLPPPGAGYNPDAYNAPMAPLPMYPLTLPTLGMPPNARQMPQFPTETVYMYVPNNMVGALIGTKGVHIRNVMRMTGANIRIESKENEPGPPVEHQPLQPSVSNGQPKELQCPSDADRLVTIVGTEPQQYKVRELQRVTGAQVKIPDNEAPPAQLEQSEPNVSSAQGGADGENNRPTKITSVNNPSEETTVRVIGNFTASQAVQNRIRMLVHQHHQQMMRMGGAGIGAGAAPMSGMEQQMQAVSLHDG